MDVEIDNTFFPPNIPGERMVNSLPNVMLPFANQGPLVWFVAVTAVSLSAWITHRPSAEQNAEGLVVRLKKSDLADLSEENFWWRSVTFWWLLCVLGMFSLIFIFSFIL